MYYILLDFNDIVVAISKTLDRQETTNYYLIDNGTIAIPDNFIHKVVELDTLPSNAFPQVCKFIDGEFVPYVSEIERIRQDAQEELMAELISEEVI